MDYYMMQLCYTKKDNFQSKHNKFKKKKKKKFKISFCMTCMNRLHHVKQTLETSILANRPYKNVEFVLLDYNSKDGLGQWVKNKMMKDIESGILNYYQMTNPKPRYFNVPHAKNIAHKLGTGDILCNLDADNFGYKNDTNYIMDVFLDHFDHNVFIASCGQWLRKKKNIS